MAPKKPRKRKGVEHNDAAPAKRHRTRSTTAARNRVEPDPDEDTQAAEANGGEGTIEDDQDIDDVDDADDADDDPAPSKAGAGRATKGATKSAAKGTSRGGGKTTASQRKNEPKPKAGTRTKKSDKPKKGSKKTTETAAEGEADDGEDRTTPIEPVQGPPRRSHQPTVQDAPGPSPRRPARSNVISPVGRPSPARPSPAPLGINLSQRPQNPTNTISPMFDSAEPHGSVPGSPQEPRPSDFERSPSDSQGNDSDPWSPPDSLDLTDLLDPATPDPEAPELSFNGSDLGDADLPTLLEPRDADVLERLDVLARLDLLESLDELRRRDALEVEAEMTTFGPDPSASNPVATTNPNQPHGNPTPGPARNFTSTPAANPNQPLGNSTTGPAGHFSSAPAPNPNQPPRNPTTGSAGNSSFTTARNSNRPPANTNTVPVGTSTQPPPGNPSPNATPATVAAAPSRDQTRTNPAIPDAALRMGLDRGTYNRFQHIIGQATPDERHVLDLVVQEQAQNVQGTQAAQGSQAAQPPPRPPQEWIQLVDSGPKTLFGIPLGAAKYDPRAQNVANRFATRLTNPLAAGDFFDRRMRGLQAIKAGPNEIVNQIPGQTWPNIGADRYDGDFGLLVRILQEWLDRRRLPLTAPSARDRDIEQTIIDGRRPADRQARYAQYERVHEDMRKGVTYYMELLDLIQFTHSSELWELFEQALDAIDQQNNAPALRLQFFANLAQNELRAAFEFSGKAIRDEWQRIHDTFLNDPTSTLPGRLAEEDNISEDLNDKVYRVQKRHQAFQIACANIRRIVLDIQQMLHGDGFEDYNYCRGVNGYVDAPPLQRATQEADLSLMALIAATGQIRTGVEP